MYRPIKVAHNEYIGEISSDEPAHPLPLQPNCNHETPPENIKDKYPNKT